ncbi:MAG: hypothetical protein A49_22450 [Methyloceanibacter sp.]|nr:MAG: hypothetical protein A49_22450 [Methyloceanibacter sp.]
MLDAIERLLALSELVAVWSRGYEMAVQPGTRLSARTFVDDRAECVAEDLTARGKIPLRHCSPSSRSNSEQKA